ncbi:sensor domain-containing diguanylate cyclase [Vibrio genomosp. F6]|uniref:sensor domain-containing diguanylate cyclase n=1 Tax=Vibrio genomosp. F6 TaxID=723172 RepID=UPI001483B195|nr:GGDEF domain-containing protein [Vibrio genomosp. F6]
MRYKKEAAVILAVSLFLGSLFSLYYHQRADSIYTDTARQIANQTLDQLEFTARESEHLRYQMKSVVSLLSHSIVLLDYTSSPEPDKKKFLEDNWKSIASKQKWFTQMGSPFIGLIRIHGVLDHSDKVSYYIVSIVDITERKELEDKFRNLSERDALTQLWNRRKFDETIDHHTALLPPGSESSQTCLALIDIDHFKLINDNSGHDEGDRVIKVVASLLAENVRDSDFVARVGGEEFAIIMPCIGLDNAELLLNRLRRLIEGSMEAPVTISIGYSNFTLDSSETYKKSDIALYESKALGRNRVTSA